MGLLKVIEWKDNSKDTIVYKYVYDIKKDFISKGSALTVRESQAAIFCDRGKMADVFLPGYYKLDTNNIPILTKLMSWKYGFESPFKSDVYFVNTKQFVDLKWGTQNPIYLKDPELGMIRVSGYGTYAFRVYDPYIFMTQLSSTGATYTTKDITDYIKSILITCLSDTLGENKIPIFELAANLRELGKIIQGSLSAELKNEYGIEITRFNFENFSLPKEIQDAIDRNTSLGIRRSNLDVELELSKAEALKAAAANTGTGGAFMGAGLGLGAGQALGSAFTQKSTEVEKKVTCPHCKASVKDGKFCPECGKPLGNACPKCGAKVNSGAKFCPDCGNTLAAKCPKCGKGVPTNTKFCPECGAKV